MDLNENLTFREMINSPIHINAELEVVLVKKGSVKVLMGKEEFSLNENQITVIPPYRLHGFEPSEDVDATVFMFPSSLAPEFFSMCKNREFSNKICTLKSSVAEYIKRAVDEYEKSESRFYEKSILYTLLAEFTTDNSFTQMSFDVSNVSRIVEYIYANIQNEISLKMLSAEFSVNETKLNEMILKYTGLGFKDFTDSMRIGIAIGLLRRKEFNITEVAYESGFETTRTFNRIFLKFMGCTPSEYKNKSLKKKEDVK